MTHKVKFTHSDKSRVHNGTEIWDDEPRWRVGKKAAGRLLDGRTWDEMPNKDVRMCTQE